MKPHSFWIMVLLSSAGFAQSFDAATVRVNRSGETRAQGSRVRGGQLTWTNLTLKAILTLAYDQDLKGGPSWLESDRFDVVAKSPGDTPVERVRVMLQTLLAERFKLAIHREEKMTPVYALVVATGGPKLPEAAASGLAACGQGEGIEGLFHRMCSNMTMAALAEALPGLARGYIDRAVVDQTGLQGSYDFKLDWTPRPVDKSEVAAGATMFDAIEKLGLKLEGKEQPMPILMIDHVERVPTEN
jgi:uncharacterized protein (TIGR03435 family)